MCYTRDHTVLRATKHEPYLTQPKNITAHWPVLISRPAEDRRLSNCVNILTCSYLISNHTRHTLVASYVKRRTYRTQANTGFFRYQHVMFALLSVVLRVYKLQYVIDYLELMTDCAQLLMLQGLHIRFI